MERACQCWRSLPDGDAGLKGEGVFLFIAGFIGFNGHFPRQPILPAVAQLAAVRYLAVQLLDRDVGLHGFHGVKFRDMVVPDEEILINILLTEDTSLWQGRFTIVKKEKKSRVADGYAVFTG